MFAAAFGQVHTKFWHGLSWVSCSRILLQPATHVCAHIRIQAQPHVRNAHLFSFADTGGMFPGQDLSKKNSDAIMKPDPDSHAVIHVSDASDAGSDGANHFNV